MVIWEIAPANNSADCYEGEETWLTKKERHCQTHRNTSRVETDHLVVIVAYHDKICYYDTIVLSCIIVCL